MDLRDVIAYILSSISAAYYQGVVDNTLSQRMGQVESYVQQSQ